MRSWQTPLALAKVLSILLTGSLVIENELGNHLKKLGPYLDANFNETLNSMLWTIQDAVSEYQEHSNTDEYASLSKLNS